MKRTQLHTSQQDLHSRGCFNLVMIALLAICLVIMGIAFAVIIMKSHG